MRYRLLILILNGLSRLALKRHKPTIIAITGSVGKTSTRRAIVEVLRAQYLNRVRSTVGNRNTEIGVPLAILGLTPAGNNPLGWLLRICKGCFAVLWNPRYPEVLVLEMSANKPGNIYNLAQLAPPHIAVVTEIGEIPGDVEHYVGPKNLAREQARVVEALPVDGWAVLNGEDPMVIAMRERTGAHVRTYGFSEEGEFDVNALAFELRSRQEGGDFVPDGVRFKVEYKGKVIPVRLSGTYGQGIVRAALAATAVGLALNMNLVEISEALAGLKGPEGRLKILQSVKRTILIDDSYNASPPSIQLALETLAEAPAGRRIAVLGDMLGLGQFTEAAHQRVGSQVAAVADVLVTIGERMRFAADEAQAHGLPAEKSFRYATAQDAARPVQELIRPGDVILVTGSRAMEMEKIVEEIRASS